MSYCPECGAEVSEKAKFCSECGGSLTSEAEKTEEASIEDRSVNTRSPEQTVEDKGIHTNLAIASGVMGFIVGLVVAFAFTNFGGGPFWFLITLGGVGYFLYRRKESVKKTVGMGLYILALWMPLSPILFYLGLAGSATTDTARGAGTMIGSILGMFVYGFIGIIIGLVFAAIGYYLRRSE
ncbi:MAG: zinc-ribbon domain-containing protein [Halobacteria archaeon]